jgi:hypothetical protein
VREHLFRRAVEPLCISSDHTVYKWRHNRPYLQFYGFSCGYIGYTIMRDFPCMLIYDNYWILVCF